MNTYNLTNFTSATVAVQTSSLRTTLKFRTTRQLRQLVSISGNS
jgi:hypothetical protein